MTGLAVFRGKRTLETRNKSKNQQQVGIAYSHIMKLLQIS